MTNTDNFVSVITVCFNAADSIAMTMESVLAQTYDHFEYIIKDGASTDNTADIVNSYLPKFEERGISVKFVSEPDSGIYDAMNIAVSLASGTWVNFMNSGDCFYSSTVLSDIFADRSYITAAIIYGDCAEYEYGRFYLFPKNFDNIKSAMPFSHQTVFARRELLSRIPLKCEFRYSADYDFLLTAHDMQLQFVDSECIVCITNKDGVSSVNYADMLKESALILKNHNIEAPLDGSKGSGSILKLKQFVLDHFPTFIKKFIRGVQIKKRHQDFNVTVPSWHPAYHRIKK